MNEDLKAPGLSKSKEFSLNVGKKEKRKLRARKDSSGVWFGLGMMGLIGWSVIIPALLGAALGIWLDKHYSDSHSWTLSLLIAGLCIGCLNAWRWMSRQHQDMQEEQENHDE